MISVVIYGRNDSYGYNLNKRAALSLNCIAHLLSDPDDEILFVDYNTPDDFPTFPEAIRDTLTDDVFQWLRILRVRPALHRLYERKTHLPVLEAIARNVAVRRSNPRNRWVLSTNSDMIFVPRTESSLSKLSSGLAPGYYHIPRFDIPESVWENFDRRDAPGTIEACRSLGHDIHLNEIVRSQPFFLYDAPGDFQLFLRKDAFELFGFCEDMLLGWHIDANMSKRLHLKYGEVGDLADKLSGYHCNHMRQATPKHSETRTDDWATNVDEVESPHITSQAESWGYPLADIEEIRLSSCPSDRYREALPHILGEQMLEPTSIMYRAESYDRVGYDARHVLPYLADLFVNCPREWNVGWFGENGDLLKLFAEAWARLGFKGRIFVKTGAAKPAATLDGPIDELALNDIIQRADAFLFDFGGITGNGPIDQQPIEIKEQAANLLASFWDVVDLERDAEREHRRKRRIITVNTMNSYLERLVVDNLAVARTRISTRLRHGFALWGEKRQDQWLSDMEVGVAGVRFEGGIRTRDRVPGHVMYGPYKALWPGRHRLRVHMEVAPLTTTNADAPLALEVVNRENFLVRLPFSGPELARREQVIEFDVSDLLATSVEVRLWSSGEAEAIVSSVTIERAGPGVVAESTLN